MPALVTATVLHWAAEGSVGSQAVVLKDSTPISVVVGDTVSSTDVTPIIAEYIISKKEPNYDKLLRAARGGLLQVTDIHRTPLTTPALPPKQPDETPATAAAPVQGGNRPR